jgi:hypothetical protein
VTLANLLPEEPEALGLAALISLSLSRAPAREPQGELVPLEEQDTMLWDRALIAQGEQRRQLRVAAAGMYAFAVIGCRSGCVAIAVSSRLRACAVSSADDSQIKRYPFLSGQVVSFHVDSWRTVRSWGAVVNAADFQMGYTVQPDPRQFLTLNSAKNDEALANLSNDGRSTFGLSCQDVRNASAVAQNRICRALLDTRVQRVSADHEQE